MDELSKERASVRLGPKTLRTLDEEVKSLVSAWRLLLSLVIQAKGMLEVKRLAVELRV